MYGMFFVELFRFAKVKFGEDAWDNALKESGLGPRVYTASGEYPDEEIFVLLSAFSKIKGVPVSTVLEDFGEFWAEGLLKVYGPFVNPDWKLLDLIENTESLIEKSVRSRRDKEEAPGMKVSRKGSDEIIISYFDPRKMCGLVKGLAKGFAKHYDEKVQVTETSCMLKGDPVCEISVKLAK